MNESSIFLIPIFGIIFSFGTVIAVAWFLSVNRRRRAQLRAEVQMKLIERFGTASDFVQFMQSPEGKDFLGDAPTVARDRAAGGVRAGIILGFIGLAFLLCGFTEHDRGFFIPAFILGSLGAGFFVSSLVSSRIARSFEGGPSNRISGS